MSDCLTSVEALRVKLASLFDGSSSSDDFLTPVKSCSDPLDGLYHLYEAAFSALAAVQETHDPSSTSAMAVAQTLQQFAVEMSHYPWANLPPAQIHQLCSMWTSISLKSTWTWASPVLLATLVEALFSLQIPSPAPALVAARKLDVVFGTLRTFEEILVVTSRNPASTTPHWSLFTVAITRQLQQSRDVVRALLPYRVFVSHHVLSLAMRHTPPSESAMLLTIAVMQQWFHELGFWACLRSREGLDWRLRIDTQALRYRALRHGLSPAVGRQQADVVYWNDLVLSSGSMSRETSPLPAFSPLRGWCEDVEAHGHDVLCAAVAALAQAVPTAFALPLTATVVHSLPHLARRWVEARSGHTDETAAQWWRAVWAWRGDGDGIAEEVLRPGAAWTAAVLLLARPGMQTVADLCALLLGAVRGDWLAERREGPRTRRAEVRTACVAWMLQLRWLVGLLAHASPLVLSPDTLLALLQGLLEAVLLDLHAHHTDVLASCSLEVWTSGSGSGSGSGGLDICPSRDLAARPLGRRAAWRRACRAAAMDGLVYVLLHRIEAVAALPMEAEGGAPPALRTNVSLLLTDYWSVCTGLLTAGLLLPLALFARPVLRLPLALDDAVLRHRVHVWHTATGGLDGLAAIFHVPRLDRPWRRAAGHPQRVALDLRLLPWPCTLPGTVFPNPHSLREADVAALVTAVSRHLVSPAECPGEPRDAVSLLDLPADVLVHILVHLSYRRVVRLAAVCREIHGVVQGDGGGGLWRRLYRDTFPGHGFADQRLDAFEARQQAVAGERAREAGEAGRALAAMRAGMRGCPHCLGGRHVGQAAAAETRAAQPRGRLSVCWSGHVHHDWRWLLQERVMLVRRASRLYGQRFSTCPLIGCNAIIPRHRGGSQAERRDKHLRQHIDQLLRAAQPGRRREDLPEAVRS